MTHISHSTKAGKSHWTTCLCSLLLGLVWSLAVHGQTSDEESVIDRENANTSTHADRNELTGELAVFEASLRHDPDNVPSLVRSSEIYLQLGRTKEGLRNLARAVELKPDDYALHLKLAKAYEKHAAIKDALREYQYIIRHAPATDPEVKEASLAMASLLGSQPTPVTENTVDSDQTASEETPTTSKTPAQEVPTQPTPAEKPAAPVSAAPGITERSPVPETLVQIPIAASSPAAEVPAQPMPAEKTAVEVPTQPMPAEQPAAEVPAQPMPAEQPAAEVPAQPTPAEQPAAEVPTQPTPAEQPAAEVPTQPTPAEQPAAEVSAQPMPAEKTAAEVPAQPTPAEQPAAEVPAQPTPAEKPAQSPTARRQQAPQASVADLIAEGNRLRDQGKGKEALRAYQAALAQEPENPQALFYVGNFYLQHYQFEPGLIFLARSVAQAPDNHKLRLILANAYQRYATEDEAIQEYQRVVENTAADSEDSKEANRHLRVLLERRKERLNAARDAAGMSAQDERTVESTDDVTALIAEGKQLAAKHDTAKALYVFETASTLQPDNPEILFYIGNLNLELHRVETGLRNLSRSVGLAPVSYQIRLLLANAYQEFATEDEAIREYKRVIKLAPADSPQAREADSKLQDLLQKRKARLGEDLYKQAENGDSSDIPALMAEGKRHGDQGEFQQALHTFETASALEPGNPEILYFIGNLMLKLKDSESGLRYLSRSVTLDPDNVQARMVLARAYGQFGTPEEAIRQYQQVLGGVSADSKEAREIQLTLRLLNAKQTLLQGNPELAETQYTALLNDYPGNRVLLKNIITAYIQTKHSADLQNFLEKLVAENPDNVSLRSYLVEQYERSGELQKAIEGYNQLIPLVPPESPQIATNIKTRIIQLKGALALQQGDSEEIEKQYEQLQVINPDNVNVAINLAIALAQLGHSDRSEEILQTLADKHPDNPDVRLRLGIFKFNNGQREEGATELVETMIRGNGTPAGNAASQQLETFYKTKEGGELKSSIEDAVLQKRQDAAESDPDNYDAWVSLGQAARILKNSDKLLVAYENMVRIKPEDGRNQAVLGELYDTKGEFAKAVDHYTAALAQVEDPRIKEVTANKLALASARKEFAEDNKDKAEAEFKAILEKNPDNYIAHFYLALIYSSQNKLKEAASEYEEVVRIIPTHPTAHLSLASLYEQLRREEDALTEYRTALRLALPEDLVKVAQRRMEALAKRLDGFTFSLNYSTGYLSNFNLRRDNPTEEYRTRLAGNVTYRHKLRGKSIYLGLTATSNYVIYHQIEFDQLNMGFQPFTTFNIDDLDFSISLTHSQTSTVLTDTDLSSSDSFNSDVSGDFTMPRLLRWLAGDETGPGIWSMSLSANQYESLGNPLFNAVTYTVGGSLNQPMDNGWRWVAGYNYSVNDNTDTRGSDFAYTSHSVSLQVNKFIGAGLSVNASYSFSYFAYTNPDSATLFTARRKNLTQNTSIGINYAIAPELRVFANMGYQLNESNLPTGFILSNQDAATAIGIQSSSLGDYKNTMFTAGMSFNF